MPHSNVRRQPSEHAPWPRASAATPDKGNSRPSTHANAAGTSSPHVRAAHPPATRHSQPKQHAAQHRHQKAPHIHPQPYDELHGPSRPLHRTALPPRGAAAAPVGASPTPIGAFTAPADTPTTPAGAASAHSGAATPAGASTAPTGAPAAWTSATAAPATAAAAHLGAAQAPVSASTAPAGASSLQREIGTARAQQTCCEPAAPRSATSTQAATEPPPHLRRFNTTCRGAPRGKPPPEQAQARRAASAHTGDRRSNAGKAGPLRNLNADLNTGHAPSYII